MSANSEQSATPVPAATTPGTHRLSKVLIANRGEIAVRIIRACTDAGIGSRRGLRRPRPRRPARHGSPTRPTPSAAPRRPSPTSTSRRSSRSPAKSGADAVHPGYGFLAENAEFAQAVHRRRADLDRPAPEAIDALGDKVKARHIAEQVGAPLVPGTTDPVERRRRGRRLRRGARPAGRHQGRLRRRRPRPQGRPRRCEEIPELFESAVREAVTAFGRGECFVERFLDQPAPRRDPVPGRPARQRRRRLHPRLLAAAPQPEARRGGARAVPHRRADRPSSTSPPRRSCSEAGYVGAGTCEFLVGQDGTISFLEVNTRLQVEHPRLRGGHRHRPGPRAVPHRRRRGARLRRPRGPRPLHRVPHQRRGRRPRLPARPRHASPRWRPPAGPGVRVDAGSIRATIIAGAFDSLLAKLIVTGRDPHAGARALAPRPRRVRGRGHAHRHPVPPRRRRRPGVRRPDPTASRSRSTPAGSRPSSTTRSRPYAGGPAEARRGRRAPDASSSRSAASASRSSLPGGARLGVGGGGGRPAPRSPSAPAAGRPAPRPRGDPLTSPMQGTIVKVAVEEGARGRRGRPRRRPRGDEDGAAAQRPQGRHRHRALRRGRRDRLHRRRHRQDQGRRKPAE